MTTDPNSKEGEQLEPLLSDFMIEQHSGGYLNQSNMPGQVFTRRTEDIATGMRLARLAYETNPGLIRASRLSDKARIKELEGLGRAMKERIAELDREILAYGTDRDPRTDTGLHVLVARRDEVEWWVAKAAELTPSTK